MDKKYMIMGWIVLVCLTVIINASGSSLSLPFVFAKLFMGREGGYLAWNAKAKWLQDKLCLLHPDHSVRIITSPEGLLLHASHNKAAPCQAMSPVRCLADLRCRLCDVAWSLLVNSVKIGL